jgi:sugar O-acyltransferase (sialic acid O-acetyltransferase NeuD family)
LDKADVLTLRAHDYSRVMLYIVGGGGHGSDVADLALRCGITPAGIADDRNVDARRFASRGIPVSGPIPDLPRDATFTFGIGTPEVRHKLAPRVPCAPGEPLIDPSATVSPTGTQGAGTQIFWHASVGPLCRLGEHVLVSYGATIGHDCVLADTVCVLPGAHVAGDVTIEEGALIGVGAIVAQGVRIGEGARIGEGVIVTRPVAAGEEVPAPDVRSLRR